MVAVVETNPPVVGVDMLEGNELHLKFARQVKGVPPVNDVLATHWSIVWSS